MPGPILTATEAWDLAQREKVCAAERHRLAQLVADHHARRFAGGMNTCETSQCQCKEIARLLNNNFQKGTA